ncbi:MAG: porin family protein [Flavobacteriaceae bacterium]
MKKKLTLLLFFVFSILVFAQKKIRPGLRLGLNVANISNTILEDKIGANAGVFVDIRFSDFYTMQPELIYSMQGGKSTFENTEDLNINYLSIGLVNKFYIIPRQGLHLLLGASFDFDFENNIINVINGSNDSEVTPFDLSVLMGIGYEFDFGLIIEARYKQGLLNIDLFRDNFDSEFYDGEENNLNTVFQFGLAYKFDI